MAKMIPPQYDQSIPSAAEKRIFHLLENDPDTTQWFVFHSMGLAKRPTGPYGEIDFVVLIPSGAVICLEVKGGRVSCKDGVWRTVDRFGATSELKKSPFMQAREGMFALLKAIQEKFGRGSETCKCLFDYAVIFPDVDTPPKTPEFEPWECVGRDDLQSPISKIILNIVDSQRRKLGGWKSPSSPESSIRDIRQFLRPDFERVILRATIVRQCESAIVSLTDDQYNVLDMISDNPRCLIEGAAGTGKTVLALEYSRRQAKAGKKVLLLCFNRLLGDWLEHSAKNCGEQKLQASSYFRFLRELTLASVYREEFETASQGVSQEKLFSDLLPFYAQLSAETLDVQYDLLVIDEAQDLLSPQALEIFGTLVKGGITGGQWFLFGDFTRQCIFGGSPRDVYLQTLLAACPYFTQTQLKTNCRNTRRIGEETALLSGFSSLPYKLGQIDGPPVDYRYWKNREQELEKLAEVAQQLLTEGMSPRDIVLLSSRTFADSVAAKLACTTQKHGEIHVEEIRKGAHPVAGDSTLGFATVQSFKGMESPVIILCDVDQVENDEPQALLYTGMSRARSLLVMMVRDSAKEAIARAFMRKLNESWKS
jgi:hypothetical protein